MSIQPPLSSNSTSSSISLNSSSHTSTLPLSKWALTPAEKTKYLTVYNSLQKEADGSISGPVARETLLKSKLDNSKLIQAWQLSDSNGVGKLTKSQFCICMHLVYKAINGENLPNTLPIECLNSVKELEIVNNFSVPPQLSPTSTLTPITPNMQNNNNIIKTPISGSLQPSPILNSNNSRLSSRTHNSGSMSSDNNNLSNFADFSKLPQVSSNTTPKLERTGSMLSQGSHNSLGFNQNSSFSSKTAPSLTQAPSQTSITSTIEMSSNNNSPYYIPAERKQNYQNYFNQEKTVDDFIEGAAARKIFVQSGQPLEFLSQIWNLVDLEQTGRLSEPQFVLAMHLLTIKCQSNIPPPLSLSDKEILEYFSSNNQNIEGFQDPEDLSETLKEIEELKRQKLMFDNDMKTKEERLSEIRKNTEKLQDSINEVNTALANLSTEKIVKQRQLDNKQVERSECSVSREEIMKKREESRKAMMAKQSEHMEAKGKLNKSVNDEERLQRIVQNLANITARMINS